MSELPRLLSDLDPVPGVIKEDYADFVVEEIPRYPFDGRGTHTCFLIEKRGLSTVQSAADVARALNVRRRDVGYAGLKDARAVARQWFSVEHVDPQSVQDLHIPRMRVLQVTRHGNKLRLGHLRCNRFTIRVRRADAARAAELRDGLQRLCREGVPNYFGPQRFGGRGDTWAVGRALLGRDLDEAIDVMLGRPGAADQGDARRARELYEQERYADAARQWPGLFRNERRALRVLARTGGDRRRAMRAIDRSSRRFYVSAYQSFLFNRVAAGRLALGLGTLLEGDVAYIHAADKVFLVEDPAREQPRADSFDISPTGPMFGYRMTPAQGLPGRMEAEVLSAERLPADAFRAGGLRIRGARRALRVQPQDAIMELGADERGPYVELRFGLPRGSYATALLRELFRETATLEPPAAAGQEEL